MPEFAPGTRYGGFQIVSLLGRGMSGSVYRAMRDGRVVALKFLESRDEKVRSYFLNEVALLRQAQSRSHSAYHRVCHQQHHPRAVFSGDELLRGQLRVDQGA